MVVRLVVTATLSNGCLSASTDHGKNICSTVTTIWNSTMPMMRQQTSAPQASCTLKNAVEVWIR